MYAFDIATDLPKTELYAELLKAADALTAGEPDGIANMANISALIWQFVPDLNWAGFYRMVGHSTRGYAGRPGEPEQRNWLKMSTPFPVISPVMRKAGRNWSFR